jgi:hypothetical protein
VNRQETAKILAVLTAGFPHINLSRESVEVYHEALKDLDYGAAQGAVREILLSAEFFPPPAVIRRKVAERAGVLAPSGGEAWSEVTTQARIEGLRGSPTFSHPAIRKVVDQLGWYDICMSTNTDTLRAHFLKAYEQIRTVSDSKTIADALVGLSEGFARPALEARS